MGYLMVNVQLPDSSSSERTLDVMSRAEQIVLETPGILHTLEFPGNSFLLGGYGSNFGSMFVVLKDFDERQDPHLYADAIAATLTGRLHAEILDAATAVYGPPPVRGVGRAGGFKFMIEDRGDLGLAALQEQTDRIAEEARREGGVVGLTSVFRANVPQLYVDVDRKEALQKHVPLEDVTDTLEAYLGSLYVNDFNRFGRTWQVIVQADGPSARRPSTINRLRLRSDLGKMVPLGTLAAVRTTNGPMSITRYNMYPAAFINGEPPPASVPGKPSSIMQRWPTPPAPRHVLRMDRDRLPGTPGRQYRHHHPRLLRGDGLPRPGRPV